MARRPGPGGPMAGGGGRPMGPSPKVKTAVFREWRSLNLTDWRGSIDDNDLSWEENALTIGKGFIQILRSPGPTLATIAAGIDTIWGFTLKIPGAIIMTVNADGSMSQVQVPSGTVTPVAPAGTFSAGHATHLSIWRNEYVLIIDPVAGYFWWDGNALGGNVITGVPVHESSPAAMSIDVDAGSVNFWNVTNPLAVGAAVNVPIAAADPTNPRIDLVTVDNTGAIVIATGTPAPTPVAPAPPTSAGFQNIVLAQVFVGAGVLSILDANITDLRADTTLTGENIAVFEGRVWISKGRVLTFSAPGSFIDFSIANGGGFTNITDENFEGNIVALVSALEQLWILGHGAIDALANVTAVGTGPVVTSFSITNILTNVGTNAPHSVLGYFRALALLAPFGIYALSGVTPQKLSDKIDGLFPDLILDDSNSACVAVVENLLCLFFLATYTGNQAQSGPPPIPVLIGFIQGKLFLAVQGLGLKWVTSVIVGGVTQGWGTEGSTLYQLFGADASTPTTYKVQTKLFDFGQATTEKAATKLGYEFQANLPIRPTITIDSETSSLIVPLTTSNTITRIINNMGVPMQLVNNNGDPLNILTQGIILSKSDTSMFGHYLGSTIVGTDPPYRVQAVEMEYSPTREWDTSP